MGAVIFSDVHADYEAFGLMCDIIRGPEFTGRFGQIDSLVNLGDLLHRGDHPEEVLASVTALSRKYRLVSVLGNHDHAFLHGIAVSGSDASSLYRHEQIRNSPLLAIFNGMPMEHVEGGALFVHGGPMELGPGTLRLKCWQRLGSEPGDTFAGYNYTPGMAFAALEQRGLRFLCCGHQHSTACYRKYDRGIQDAWLDYVPGGTGTGSHEYEVAEVPLNLPAIFRVGACSGREPEFAFIGNSAFSFIRIV